MIAVLPGRQSPGNDFRSSMLGASTGTGVLSLKVSVGVADAVAVAVATVVGVSLGVCRGVLVEVFGGV
jgi:hypothetical protein